MNIYYHLSIVLKFLLGKIHAHTHPSSLDVYQTQKTFVAVKAVGVSPSQPESHYFWMDNSSTVRSPRVKAQSCNSDQLTTTEIQGPPVWRICLMSKSQAAGNTPNWNMHWAKHGGSVRNFCTFLTGLPLGTGSSLLLSSWAVREASQARWLHLWHEASSWLLSSSS